MLKYIILIQLINNYLYIQTRQIQNVRQLTTHNTHRESNRPFSLLTIINK